MYFGFFFSHCRRTWETQTIFLIRFHFAARNYRRGTNYSALRNKKIRYLFTHNWVLWIICFCTFQVFPFGRFRIGSFEIFWPTYLQVRVLPWASSMMSTSPFQMPACPFWLNRRRKARSSSRSLAWENHAALSLFFKVTASRHTWKFTTFGTQFDLSCRNHCSAANAWRSTI